MSAARIPPALALAWLEQAGRALDAAHAAGVVHRDVKPANLMLGGDGEVRVTDFGIARIAGDASLTSVGTILGTSGYMSPEQAVGGTATAASDRYGLAVVAFELLCGRRPYLAETLRGRGRGARDGADPGGDALRPLAAALDRRRLRARPGEGSGASASARAASSSRALRSAFAESAATTVRIAPPVDAPTGRHRRTRAKRDIPRAPRRARGARRSRPGRAADARGSWTGQSKPRRRRRSCGRRRSPGSPWSGPSPSRRSNRRRRQDPAAERRLAGPGRHGRRRAQRSGIQAAPGAATPPPRCRCSSGPSARCRAPAR